MAQVRKVAIVTGASRGLGYEFAKTLAKNGYSLGLLARKKETLEPVARELNGIFEVGDATDFKAVKRLVERTESEFGAIDAFVANAGVWGPIGRTWKVEPDEWWDAFSINAKSAMVAVSASVPHMMKHKDKTSRIVVLSAQAGATNMRWPLCSSYSASKAAVNKLVENVAFELRPSKIKIFAYNPGFMDIGISQQAKTLINSQDPDVKQTASMVLMGIEKKKTTPIAKTCDGLLKLAEGHFDQKSGSYLTVDDVSTPPS